VKSTPSQCRQPSAHAPFSADRQEDYL
jgi:hypothetical protein